MWQVNVETEKIGPMQYRIWTPDIMVPDRTKIEIQDIEPYEQPVIHTVTGQSAIEYMFPKPGQYRVKILAWREQEDIPNYLDAGVGGKIIKVAAETVPEEKPPEEESPEPPAENPPAIPKDDLIRTGIRVLDWMLDMERTEAQAFVVGFLLGAAAGAVTALLCLG